MTEPDPPAPAPDPDEPLLTPLETLTDRGAAPVRVNCHSCQVELYAGDTLPDGDVFAAAGCPDTCPGATGSRMARDTGPLEELGAVDDLGSTVGAQLPSLVEVSGGGEQHPLMSQAVTSSRKLTNMLRTQDRRQARPRR